VEGDERVVLDEFAEDGVAAKVTPSEDGARKPNPSGVAMSEGADHRDGFSFVEETMFGHEALTCETDFSGGTGVQVAKPVGVRSPSRKDHDLARAAVVGEHHRHRVVRLSGDATDMYQHEERAAQHPASVVVIQPQWRAEYR
jgi:hypothetical protein